MYVYPDCNGQHSRKNDNAENKQDHCWNNALRMKELIGSTRKMESLAIVENMGKSFQAVLKRVGGHRHSGKVEVMVLSY